VQGIAAKPRLSSVDQEKKNKGAANLLANTQEMMAVHNDEATKDTMSRVNGVSANKAQANVDEIVNSELAFINQVNGAYDDSYTNRHRKVVETTNQYSDLTQMNIQSVSYQHELNKYNRALNAQAYGEQVNARYQRGNQIAADEFAKFQPIQNDLLTGVDVEANIAWGQQRRDAFNRSFIGVASNAGKMIKENGGFVVAYGVTGGASAGAGVDAAYGSFLAVDFNKWSLTTGNYGSTEFAANFGIPVPEAHGGVELSLYMTPDFLAALEGRYSISGGATSLALNTIDLGVVRTDKGKHYGLQATYTRDLDATKILPKFSNGNGYYKGGTGAIYYEHAWW